MRAILSASILQKKDEMVIHKHVQFKVKFVRKNNSCAPFLRRKLSYWVMP